MADNKESEIQQENNEEEQLDELIDQLEKKFVELEENLKTRVDSLNN